MKFWLSVIPVVLTEFVSVRRCRLLVTLHFLAKQIKTVILKVDIVISPGHPRFTLSSVLFIYLFFVISFTSLFTSVANFLYDLFALIELISNKFTISYGPCLLLA